HHALKCALHVFSLNGTADIDCGVRRITSGNRCSSLTQTSGPTLNILLLSFIECACAQFSSRVMLTSATLPQHFDPKQALLHGSQYPASPLECHRLGGVRNQERCFSPL